MAENHTCSQEKVIEIILNKLDSLDSFRDIVTEIKMLVKTQTEHLRKVDEMIEKQNIRSDKQDVRADKQDLLFVEVSNNMKSISQEQKILKEDIKELKKDSTIQIKVMPLIKKVLLKIIFPGSAIGFLLWEAGKALKIFK
jgi:hypothetical protein